MMEIAVLFTVLCFIGGGFKGYKQSSEHTINKYPTANIQFGEAGNPNLDYHYIKEVRINGKEYLSSTENLEQ